MSPQYCRAFVIASMLFPDFVNVSPNYELYPFFPKLGFVVVCFSAEKEQSQLDVIITYRSTLIVIRLRSSSYEVILQLSDFRFPFVKVRRGSLQ